MGEPCLYLFLEPYGIFRLTNFAIIGQDGHAELNVDLTKIEEFEYKEVREAPERLRVGLEGKVVAWLGLHFEDQLCGLFERKS